MLWPRCTQSHEVFENVSNSAAIMHCKSELGFGKTGVHEICPHDLYQTYCYLYAMYLFYIANYDVIGKSPQIYKCLIELKKSFSKRFY